MNTKPKCEDEAIVDETITAELDDACKQKIAALEAQVEDLKQQVAGYKTQSGVEAEMLTHWVGIQTDDSCLRNANYLDKVDLQAGLTSLLEQHTEYLNAVRAANKLQVMMAARPGFGRLTTNIRFIPGDGTSPTFEIRVYDKHSELVGAFKWFKNLECITTWVPNIDDIEDVDEGEEQEPILELQSSFKAAFKVWMKWYLRNY